MSAKEWLNVVAMVVGPIIGVVVSSLLYPIHLLAVSAKNEGRGTAPALLQPYGSKRTPCVELRSRAASTREANGRLMENGPRPFACAVTSGGPAM